MYDFIRYNYHVSHQHHNCNQCRCQSTESGDKTLL